MKQRDSESAPLSGGVSNYVQESEESVQSGAASQAATFGRYGPKLFSRQTTRRRRWRH